MLFNLKNINLQKVCEFLTEVFLFLLPWQTIWIYRESFLNGVKWEYGTLGFYGTELLLWTVVVLFMWWYWKEKKFRNLSRSERDPVEAGEIKKFRLTKDRVFTLAVLLFIIYYLSSLFWSIDKFLALQQSLRVLEAILLFFIIYIGPFEKEKLAKWFVYGAILPALLGVWQFVTQSTFASALLGLSSHPVWEAGVSIIQSDAIGRWLRVYGPFAHPNVFGGYMVIVLLFYCFIVGLRKEKSRKRIILFFILYSLFFTSLFFTFSRSAWIAAIITLLPYYLITKKYYLAVLSFIIIAILSIICFPLLQTRFSNQSISEIRSSEERVSGYNEAWQIFRRHPLLGVGAGNYTLALHQLNPERPGWEYQPAHNVFALFAVEQGIIGVGLFILVLISFVIYYKNLQSSVFGLSLLHNNKNLHIAFLVFMFLCFVVLMSFDHYLYSSYVGLMLSAIYFALLFKNSTQNFHN